MGNVRVVKQTEPERFPGVSMKRVFYGGGKMNETLKNIHYLMAQIWIDKDGIGLNAYDDAYYKTMSEKYGFICESYERAKEIMEECKSQ